jgi:hypothetical protein
VEAHAESSRDVSRTTRPLVSQGKEIFIIETLNY